MRRGSNRGNNGYIGVNQANIPTSGVIGPNKLYNTEIYEQPIYPGENSKDALGLTAYYNYNRPIEWPALPDVTAGTQQIVGLHAVYNNDSNVCAVQIQGAYNVDWGDGTTGAFASNAVATKRYDTTTYAGLTSSVVTSRGGTYKTVLIKITPQTGQNFTTVDFMATPTGITGWPTTTGGLWLDIRMAGANVTTLTVSRWYYNSRANNMLELFEYVGPAALTSLSFISSTSLRKIVQFPSTRAITNGFGSLFHTCYSLQEIPASILDGLINSSTVTSMNYTFYYMHSLRYFPVSAFNVPNVTSLSGAFLGCQIAKRLPVIKDTSKVTLFDSAFNGCYNVEVFPPVDTRAATNVSYMYNGCNNMIAPPSGLSTGNVTNFQGMFNGCLRMVSAPVLNTSKATDMSLMFAGCAALKTIPQYDYSLVTTLSQFGRYSGIQWAPTFNTGTALTNTANMWEFNPKLLDAPLITNMTNVTTIANMFNGCEAIRTIPGITFANHTTTTTPFGTYNASNLNHLKNLASIDAKGISFSIDLRNAVMGATALNTLYTNLATVGVSGAGAKTLQVSGNWGYTASNTMTAISKGWAVS